MLLRLWPIKITGTEMVCMITLDPKVENGKDVPDNDQLRRPLPPVVFSRRCNSFCAFDTTSDVSKVKILCSLPTSNYLFTFSFSHFSFLFTEYCYLPLPFVELKSSY